MGFVRHPCRHSDILLKHKVCSLLGTDMQSVDEGLHVAEGLDAVAVNMEAILHTVIYRSLLWMLDCTSTPLPVRTSTMQDM